MINSSFLDFKNKIFEFFQNLFAPLVENSFILSRIDDVIMFFIALTLIGSAFLESEKIGLLAIIVIALTLIKLLIKKGAKIQLFSFDGALILYFAICLISTFNSELLLQSVHGFLKTVIYIFYYFCAANYFQTNQNKIRYFFLLIGTLCLTESVIAIYQNMCGVEQISTWQDVNYINPEDALSRAYGTLKPLNPNLLGGYLIAGISCIIAAGMNCLFQKKYKTFSYSLISFASCMLAIFFTGCRGAYLAIGAIIAGFVVIFTKLLLSEFKGTNETSRKVKRYWGGFLGILAGLFALILIAVPQISKRLMSIFILRTDSSTSFRMNVYNSSWQMFKDNWILGIGTGNQTFREIYGLYMVSGYDALSTYSVPLEIAVEAGIFALLAFGAFIVMFLIHSIRFISASNDQNKLPEKVIVACTILTVIGVMAHGLFDTIFFRPQVQFLFWTIIAITSSIFYNNAVSEQGETGERTENDTN